MILDQLFILEFFIFVSSEYFWDWIKTKKRTRLRGKKGSRACPNWWYHRANAARETAPTESSRAGGARSDQCGRSIDHNSWATKAICWCRWPCSLSWVRSSSRTSFLNFILLQPSWLYCTILNIIYWSGNFIRKLICLLIRFVMFCKSRNVVDR